MIKKLPFVPLKVKSVLEFSKKLNLVSIASSIVRIFPNLQLTLVQAGIDMKDREYLAIAIFTSLFYFLLVNLLFLFFFFVAIVPQTIFFISLGVSVFIALLSFFYLIFYPNLIVIRKIKDLEKNLLFALRHLLVQVRSGVTLFDSMDSVSKANYGTISNEFRDVVKKISTGEFVVDVLEELALKNPSLYFRRAIWQIANSLRSGADVAKTLESMIANLASEQRVMIRRYGSQLNPLAFLYMMFGVVIPSLGITFMIILSSFSGLPIKEYYFWILLGFLVLFQFSFIGIVKNRRPSVEVYV